MHFGVGSFIAPTLSVFQWPTWILMIFMVTPAANHDELGHCYCAQLIVTNKHENENTHQRNYIGYMFNKGIKKYT